MLRLMILITLAVGLVCPACFAATWDLAGDWSTVSNPNGQWSYGRVTSGGVGSPTSYILYGVTLFANAGTHSTNTKLQQWRVNGDEITAWTYNSDSATQGWPWIGNLPSHKLGVVPGNGSGGAVAVARWTCPASGWYQISSTFQRIYTAGSTDIHIIKNSGGPHQLFYLPSMAYETRPFIGVQNVNAGETIDFCVGNGNGDWTNDGTLVDATISTTTAPGTVIGTVTSSPSGNPLYGAEIRVVGTNYYTYTAADGSYSLNLPAGNYTIQASITGHNTGQITGVAVVSGNTTNGVNLALVSWGYVTGRVTSSPEATTIPSATVNRVGGSETTTTAADGTYSIFIAPGTYTLQASKTGFDAVQRTGIVVPSGGTAANTDFALPSWGRIAGTVRSDLPGNPGISAVKVATTTGGYVAYSGPDGSYSVSVPAGNYSVNVSCSGYVSQSASGLGVSNGVVTSRNFTLASSSISGLVTSESSGSPIAGAYVRTEGDPTYYSVTGPDGSYTITAPAGSYNILVSAAGYDPQKSPSVTSAGSGKTQSFALRTASSGGSLLNLPAPLDIGEPTAAPRGFADSYPVSFGDMASAPSADAPAIAQLSNTVKPDESFTVTGVRFTTRTGADAGTDTTVWVWARTSDTGGVLRQARIWKVTENVIVATMPDDIPFGMYLVWVENSVGVSAPTCVNKAIAQWIGPLGNAVQAGNKKRVFGRNISYGHGTGVSHVYIQPAAGGAMTDCPVSTVNPYMVEFTVPSETANGSYKLYVHNGHGGIYGWSDGLDMVVQNDWVRGSTVVSVTPSGTNDSPSIQNAIDSLAGMANGGTVQLTSGNYILKGVLNLKAGVELRGASMNSTTLLLQLSASSSSPGIGVSGSNAAVRDLTLKLSSGFPRPSALAAVTDSVSVSGARFVNFSQTLDPNMLGFNFQLGPKTELSSCELLATVALPGDCWVHGGTYYGNPWGASADSAFAMTHTVPADRNIVENCLVETKDWPVNPVNGSKNYEDFVPMDQLQYIWWCRRVALIGSAYNYLAGISTKDVAIAENKGEMILFHGMDVEWFGNAISTNWLTVTLRTDGLVDGQVVAFYNGANQYLGGQPVLDRVDWWYHIDGTWAVVATGRGAGQARRIVSHTPSSVTVDRPWKIQPDSTSKVVIQPLYYANTIYSNDLNAFPIGYDQSDFTASVGVVFDGNGWDNMAEANVSHRTGAGRSTLASSGSMVSYWNEMRNERAYDINRGGISVGTNGNAVLPSLLGNAFRGGEYVVNGLTPPASYDAGGVTQAQGEGTIIENVTFTSKRGYWLKSVGTPGLWSDGLTLFRNGSITTIDSPNNPASAQPVYITVNDGKQLLVNNTYSSPAPAYLLGTGISSYSMPVALYRVAKFSGYAGYPVQSQLVPIVNAGIASMTWTVTPSDSWITASIQANGTLAAENTLGRVMIGVNTSGMAAGRHWGYVTINTGSSSVRIGVCLDVSSGTPSNQPPVPSFTTSAPAGTVPFAITFNAGASYDVDGIVTSYVWDFGDGSYGTGVTATHQYTRIATYTPTLTVTDDDGATGSSWTNIIAAPALSAVTVAGSPTGTIDVSAPVSLTATSIGGYQAQYKFMVNSGSGWQTLRDYGSSNTFTWTPSASGYYELKVWARSSVSTDAYDAVSNTLSYPVGLIPSGAKLWLKSDSGTTLSGSAVSAWADQSGTGNNVSQSNNPNMPTYVENAVNGRPVIRFTGTGQILQSTSQVLSGSTAFTTFTVGKLNELRSPANYQYFWWNGGDTSNVGYGCYLYPTTPQILRYAWGSNSASLSDPSAAVVGTLYTLSSRFSGGASGTHEMWINGGVSSPVSRTKTSAGLSGGAFSVGNYGPSAGYGLYGDVAEILIYDRSLTDTERQNVYSYLSARWTAPTVLAKDRLKDVKALSDGVLVSITSPKVATVASGVYSDGSVYISELDRTCGMKVLNAGNVTLWDNLTLTGTTDTDAVTGEKVLKVSAVSKSAGTELISLGMAGKTLSATGQLVRVWGKVKEKTASYITIDDGSGSVVRAQTDGLATTITTLPNIGDYVSVTGPCGLMAGGATVVRVRSASDIRAY